jgi:hypothetical protein
MARKLKSAQFLDNALVYCSPYKRTRQTLSNVMKGAGVQSDHIRVYEDPRLREIASFGTTYREKRAITVAGKTDLSYTYNLWNPLAEQQWAITAVQFVLMILIA